MKKFWWFFIILIILLSDIKAPLLNIKLVACAKVKFPELLRMGNEMRQLSNVMRISSIHRCAKCKQPFCSTIFGKNRICSVCMPEEKDIKQREALEKYNAWRSYDPFNVTKLAKRNTTELSINKSNKLIKLIKATLSNKSNKSNKSTKSNKSNESSESIESSKSCKLHLLNLSVLFQ